MGSVPKIYREYGAKRLIGEDYYEVPYEEYSTMGNLIKKGTEDFSTERYKTKIKTYEIVSKKHGKSTGIFINTTSYSAAKVIACIKYGFLNTSDLDLTVKEVK